MSKNHVYSNARIQTKRDTSANWETNNPVLLNGEEILVDTNAGEIRKKVGNGTKRYTELPFTDEPLRTLIGNKTELFYVTFNDDGANKTSDEILSAYNAGKVIYAKITYAGLPFTLPLGVVQSSNPMFIFGGTASGYMISLGMNKDNTYNISLSELISTDDLVSTSTDGLMTTSDKVKLDGIEEGANKYVHPSNHAATIITEDSTHRFVTDTEKSTWNAKASTAVATTSSNGLMSKEDKASLADILTRLAAVETKIQSAIYYA